MMMQIDGIILYWWNDEIEVRDGWLNHKPEHLFTHIVQEGDTALAFTRI